MPRTTCSMHPPLAWRLLEISSRFANGGPHLPTKSCHTCCSDVNMPGQPPSSLLIASQLPPSMHSQNAPSTSPPPSFHSGTPEVQPQALTHQTPHHTFNPHLSTPRLAHKLATECGWKKVVLFDLQRTKEKLAEGVEQVRRLRRGRDAGAGGHRGTNWVPLDCLLVSTPHTLMATCIFLLAQVTGDLRDKAAVEAALKGAALVFHIGSYGGWLGIGLLVSFMSPCSCLIGATRSNRGWAGGGCRPAGIAQPGPQP